MEPFRTHSGRVAVLNQDAVDTDRIIPARFLSRVSRLGYGELLFSDVRGEGFPLDLPEAAGATVLVPGTNFGCGSSREHAVWAIQQAGFKAVIARRDTDSAAYSDIFRQNSANNGLLLIELPTEEHRQLSALGSGTPVHIDLEAQTVQGGAETYPFDIDPANKRAILLGLDLIGSTLLHESDITAYETRTAVAA
ncbi:3-isopropylmalate dehydratase small subunit [bacterium]|nr:MAG: 3-isopropylmalate dehydratase small subunit [bacterium]